MKSRYYAPPHYQGDTDSRLSARLRYRTYQTLQRLCPLSRSLPRRPECQPESGFSAKPVARLRHKSGRKYHRPCDADKRMQCLRSNGTSCRRKSDNSRTLFLSSCNNHYCNQSHKHKAYSFHQRRIALASAKLSPRGTQDKPCRIKLLSPSYSL